MANAFGVSCSDGLAHVKTQPLWRDHPRRQLTCVQCDVNFGVHAVQVVENAHVQIEVAHGNVPVFRHDQVQSDKARVCLGQFESQENFCKDLLARKPAQDLIEKSDRDLTSGIGFRSAALQRALGHGKIFSEAIAGCASDVLQPACEQLLALGGKIIVPSEFLAEHGGLHSVGGVHEFEVLQMIGCGAGSGFGNGVAYMIHFRWEKLVKNNKK